MNITDINTTLKNKALQLGFDACGVARGDVVGEDSSFFNNWLGKNFQGEMGYMANHVEKRTDPRLLVENTRSVVVVLMNYFPAELQPPDAPQVAKYAYGKDYHTIIKEKLYELLNFLQETYPDKNIQGRPFTDSAPVLERYWAKQAGLGWIGKNTNLIHPQLGSFCFIGELLLNVELDYNTPLSDRCGNCSLCIEHCPTAALVAPGELDARKCLSYLTIEQKGDIPAEYQEKMNNCVFGCDSCQDICPWNRKAKAHQIADFMPPKDFLTLTSEDWRKINETQFESIFANSALQRAGYEKIRKTINIL